ncbi:MAG: cyclic nucleotide-binding domain-containing protein [Phaeospirillum sp.]|nr:cyclic nucleotide-binding domain-containing protein [Phaeospirillum sp.]
MDNTSRRVIFPAGAVIFAEGESGDTAYVVESGAVTVYKTVNGKRIEIGEVEQGGIFGEMALIDDHPRMASAMATQETACVIIGKTRLFEQMAKAPKGVRVIVSALLGNIRAMGTELAQATVILAQDKE